MKEISDKIGTGKVLLEVKDLRTYFPVRRGLLQRVKGYVRAVDGVSFSIRKGETMALVGESGCGKTTVGKSILRLLEPTSGEMIFKGGNLLKLKKRDLLPFRKQMQIIFQDPANSLDPRMQLKDIVAEGIKSFGWASSAEDLRRRVILSLERVGLSEDVIYRYPHEFSGGQRQRICIARALAVEPEFLVCDEATSSLDVSVQASILNLLKQLQAELGLTYLFITHDLSVVEYLADRVAVMYLGQIVEEADAKTIFDDPKHPYTQALLESAPSLDPEHRELKALGGEVPSPLQPPSGCRFHKRCPKRFDRCDKEPPPLYQVQANQCRCFLYDPAEANRKK